MREAAILRLPARLFHALPLRSVHPRPRPRLPLSTRRHRELRLRWSLPRLRLIRDYVRRQAGLGTSKALVERLLLLRFFLHQRIFEFEASSRVVERELLDAAGARAGRGREGICRS